MLPTPRPWYRVLYLQVLLAVALGVLLGVLFPDRSGTGHWHASALKPLGDGFIALVKMVIAPIIFCTVVHGIASMSDMKRLGRVGGKTLIYFEVVSTLALIIGLAVVNVLKPGVGFNIDPRTLDAKALAASQSAGAQAHALTTSDFLLNLIPSSFVGAFAKGDLLQVLLVAVLTAFALGGMGERGKPILRGIELASELFFGLISRIVKLAPLGALGAMAFTVGSFGLGALGRLAALMGGFYLTAALFVIVVLGLIARLAGFSIFRFIAYLKDELLLVLGTSSSETALPGMIDKTRRLGCAPSTVGLVIPTGYSFNLDGTNIYLSMAAVFLAQAMNIDLSLRDQISLLLVAMISSKGAAAVTGGGFIALAATLSVVPSIPVESLALIVGIDRFMSECRAITNLIGNGVATVVVSRWEGEVTAEQVRSRLQGQASVQYPPGSAV